MRLREFPDPGKRPGGPGAKSRKHGLNAGEENTSREQRPAQREVNNEEPAGESIRPITNKDEQKVITNSDNSAQPLGENEREGA